MKSIAITLLLVFLAPTAWAQAQSHSRTIPKDLDIRVVHGSRNRIFGGTHYTYMIDARGRARIEYSGREFAPGRTMRDILIKNKGLAPDRPNANKRLSKTQLIEILNAFDSSGFLTMNDDYEGDPRTGPNLCLVHGDERRLSILADGRKKEVSFFLGCSYGTVPEFKKFTELWDFISAALNTVRIKEARPKGE